MNITASHPRPLILQCFIPKHLPLSNELKSLAKLLAKPTAANGIPYLFDGTPPLDLARVS
jgi:hypothetical protein